jgi:hypothetical protein
MTIRGRQRDVWGMFQCPDQTQSQGSSKGLCLCAELRYGETNMQNGNGFALFASHSHIEPEIVAPDESVCQCCKAFKLRAERVKR